MSLKTIVIMTTAIIVYKGSLQICIKFHKNEWKRPLPCSSLQVADLSSRPGLRVLAVAKSQPTGCCSHPLPDFRSPSWGSHSSPGSPSCLAAAVRYCLSAAHRSWPCSCHPAFRLQHSAAASCWPAAEERGAAAAPGPLFVEAPGQEMPSCLPSVAPWRWGLQGYPWLLDALVGLKWELLNAKAQTAVCAWPLHPGFRQHSQDHLQGLAQDPFLLDLHFLLPNPGLQVLLPLWCATGWGPRHWSVLFHWRWWARLEDRAPVQTVSRNLK